MLAIRSHPPVWGALPILQNDLCNSPIVGCTRDNYDKRHIAPGDEREVSFLNSFVPSLCPKCVSGSIIKYGKTGVGLIRYKCKDCSGTFTVITGTIFDQRKISISQWLDFMVMIIGHGSFVSVK